MRADVVTNLDIGSWAIGWRMDNVMSVVHGTVCATQSYCWDTFIGLLETIPSMAPRGETRKQKIDHLRKKGYRIVKVRVVIDDPTPLLG